MFEIGEVPLHTSRVGRQRDIDVFQQAVVRPTVDFPRLELVMVVTNFDPLEDVPELLVPVLTPTDETPEEGDEPPETAPGADEVTP